MLEYLRNVNAWDHDLAFTAVRVSHSSHRPYYYYLGLEKEKQNGTQNQSLYEL